MQHTIWNVSVVFPVGIFFLLIFTFFVSSSEEAHDLIYIHKIRMSEKHHIPTEIIEHIISFCFSRCKECSMHYHFTELTKKYVLFEYRSVFHDDYGFENYKIYDIICNDCKWKLGLFGVS